MIVVKGSVGIIGRDTMEMFACWNRKFFVPTASFCKLVGNTNCTSTQHQAYRFAHPYTEDGTQAAAIDAGENGALQIGV